MRLPAPARGAAGDGLAALGVLRGSAAKWTNVVWPIKSRQTNQQTNTHYSFIGIDELTKVGSDQRSSTIQYDSKSKHSRTYGFVFERHQRSDFFVEKLYGMRARALAVHALARSRAGPPATAPAALGVLGGSAAKWTNVVWPIKSRQTNQQTNQQTNTHYSFIGIDYMLILLWTSTRTL